jgi:hypothetical protein
MYIPKPSPKPFVLAPLGAARSRTGDRYGNMPLLTELSPYWKSRGHKHVAPPELEKGGTGRFHSARLGQRCGLRPGFAWGKTFCKTMTHRPVYWAILQAD